MPAHCLWKPSSRHFVVSKYIDFWPKMLYFFWLDISTKMFHTKILRILSKTNLVWCSLWKSLTVDIISECDHIWRFGKILRFWLFFKNVLREYRSKQILLFGSKIVLIGFRTKFKTIKKLSRGFLNIHSMVLAEYRFWVNIPSKK